MEISAQIVKDLREKTGVGMMDCKKALVETGGDMEKAIEWLRKRGLAKAAKRADRAASKGVLGVHLSDDARLFAAVELNCETDFVAANTDFVQVAGNLAKHIAATGSTDPEAIKAEKLTADPTKTVGDLLAEANAKIGEAIRLGQIVLWRAESDDARFGLYVHTGGVALGVSELTAAAGKEFADLGKNLGMQIVAAKPIYLQPTDVPADVLEKEKDIYREEARQQGKPDKILDKIAEGKLNKFYQDNCLVKQLYVRDPDGSMTVEKLLQGAGLGVRRFARVIVGQS